MSIRNRTKVNQINEKRNQQIVTFVKSWCESRKLILKTQYTFVGISNMCEILQMKNL